MADWLTYEQAGERLGISAEAARQKARRLGWPVRRANRSNERTTVQVPDDATAQSRLRTDGQPYVQTYEANALTAAIEALRERAEAAEAQVARLIGDLAEQGAQAGRTAGEAALLRETLLREMAARQTADAARQAAEAEREAARVQAAEAEGRAAELRQAMQAAEARAGEATALVRELAGWMERARAEAAGAASNDNGPAAAARIAELEAELRKAKAAATRAEAAAREAAEAAQREAAEAEARAAAPPPRTGLLARLFRRGLRP